MTIAGVKLENDRVQLMVNLCGGSYFDFHFKDAPLNPINFYPGDPDQPNAMGHILCFDRWGPPTDAEKSNGIPHHGEANSQVWSIVADPQIKDDSTECSMKCSLPLGGLELTRTIRLSADEPVYFVTEKIRSLNKYGRMFNIVQHVTIAPPFLDGSTLIDNNAERGFEGKENGSLNQEEPVLRWPGALHNGETVSLRQFKNQWPRISSFVFDQKDEYGWVTACNPKQRLMLGYVWKTRDYPWINFWRSMEDGIPLALGMEFGTTGLHEPFPVVARKGKIFDRNIYAFIDADEIITKSFGSFLARIPEDYNGVDRIEVRNDTMLVREKAKISRDLTFRVEFHTNE
ncbi:MAG TPA: hypothetical protein VKZ75_05375 [Cyclobacteriaceae bacterium]|nr:hypothetical protein [Cyclobacteriaceae bacterium]